MNSIPGIEELLNEKLSSTERLVLLMKKITQESEEVEKDLGIVSGKVKVREIVREE